MKLLSILFFILGLLCIHQAQAQQNMLPESEVIKAINLEPNAGSKSCADLPEEKCYDYTGIDWEIAEFAKEFEINSDNGIHIEKKVLRNSEAKILARQAAKDAEKLVQEQKIELKKTRKDRASKAKTIAELKVILLEILDTE